MLGAKKDAYPSHLYISDKLCEVSIQSLLYHTCRRLLQVPNISEKITTHDSNLLLTCKYGFDGSLGHSAYKQKWTENIADDQNVFVTSLVPLRLQNIYRRSCMGKSKSQFYKIL